MSGFVYSPRLIDQLAISFSQRLHTMLQANRLYAHMDPRKGYDPESELHVLYYEEPSEAVIAMLGQISLHVDQSGLDMIINAQQACLLWSTAQPLISLMGHMEDYLSLKLSSQTLIKSSMRYSEKALRQSFCSDPELTRFLNDSNGYASFTQAYNDAIAGMRKIPQYSFTYPCNYLQHAAHVEEIYCQPKTRTDRRHRDVTLS